MNEKELGAYKHSIKVLKEHHVRVTIQRQIILRYLITHHTHPNIKHIHKELSHQIGNMSVATIYNILGTFNKIGLTISLPGKDNQVRFDYFGHPHFHAICKNCGRIFDVQDKNYPKLNKILKQLAKDQAGFTFSGSKVEIFGLCPVCQKKLAKNESHNR